MNQALTDLVLDASIVATLCTDTPGNDLRSALERLCVQGVRLWLYSGEIHDTLTRVQAQMHTAESALTPTSQSPASAWIKNCPNSNGWQLCHRIWNVRMTLIHWRLR